MIALVWSPWRSAMSELESATAYRMLLDSLRPTWDSFAVLQLLVQWMCSTLTNSPTIGQIMSSLSFKKQCCQSIPRGVKRWQMPVLLGPLPVNSAWNGCLISFEWLFSPDQTICYNHVVTRAYIKQRKGEACKHYRFATCSFPSDSKQNNIVYFYLKHQNVSR